MKQKLKHDNKTKLKVKHEIMKIAEETEEMQTK